MTIPHYDHVVIVGPGLIGGSLGMALKRAGLAGRVTGVGHRQVSLDRAVEMNAVDSTSLDVASSVHDADLVVLATSVARIREQIDIVAPRMKPGALLTDVGSVKGAICAAALKALKANPERGIRFVGSHPLAGSEQRGIDAAHADLFDGAVCVVTPAGNDPTEAATRIGELWKAVGSRVLCVSPEVHDQWLAQVSHMPHVAATCIVNAVCDQALDIAATGFLDTTRVASGDPALWADICMDNRVALSTALRTLAAEVTAFADDIDTGHIEALSERLARAKTRRDQRVNG